MDLQLCFELRSPVGTTPHPVLYREMLDIASWADANGFRYVNFGEHHASESGYLPSPLIACAGVAGRTRRIRMRPNILTAPLYDPITGKGVGAVSFDFSVLQHNAGDIQAKYGALITETAKTLSERLPPDKNSG